jgi:glyoxylase-like metal-dependent hydrolase (beta-lactamase superfamily II)
MNERYTFRIGKFQCIAINDGGFVGNAAMLFANAPEGELAKALHNYGEISEALPSTWTCLLVQTETETVLIDAGMGNHDTNGGKLLESLRQVGYSPADIDILILSHIHGDHILGCVRQGGELSFPNARYVMGKREWEFWTTKKSLETAPEWAAETAQRILPRLSERMSTVDGQGTVVPGIDIHPAPGHTFGHIAVEIMSEGERLIYLADTALHPIHLEYPHWTSLVDQFPEQAVQTRMGLLKRAAQLKSLVLLFHFHPFPSLGFIIEEGDSWRWQEIV